MIRETLCDISSPNESMNEFNYCAYLPKIAMPASLSWLAHIFTRTKGMCASAWEPQACCLQRDLTYWSLDGHTAHMLNAQPSFNPLFSLSESHLYTVAGTEGQRGSSGSGVLTPGLKTFWALCLRSNL